MLKKPSYLAALIALMLAIGYMTAQGGVVTAMGFLILPVLVSYIYMIFMVPRSGLISIYILNFVIIGITRYLQGIPLGLGIDANFMLIYVALFFSAFFKKFPGQMQKTTWFFWLSFGMPIRFFN